MGLMAPVASMSDIVDAFAIVDFLKHSCHVVSAYDLLRPVEVLTTRDKFTGKTSHWVLFTTESDAFPVDQADGSLFSIQGSPYALSVVKGDPSNVTSSHKLPSCSDTSIDEIHIAAARSVATLVGELLESKQDIRSFVDAVSSRFKYFTRVRLGVTMEDSMCPHIPAHSKPPPDDREHIEPFVKPEFQKLDDLLWAFAGGSRNMLQPLVLCHTVEKTN